MDGTGLIYWNMQTILMEMQGSVEIEHQVQVKVIAMELVEQEQQLHIMGLISD